MRAIYAIYCLLVLAGLSYVNYQGMSVSHAYRASQSRHARGGYRGHSYGGYNHK